MLLKNILWTMFGALAGIAWAIKSTFCSMFELAIGALIGSMLGYLISLKKNKNKGS